MEDNRKRTKLRKSLQRCISRKLKKIPPIHIPSSAIPANMASRRLFSTCRFPRTPSLDIDQAATADGNNSNRGNGHAATLSDVDRFLFENFRSLYIHDRDENVCLSSLPGTSKSLVQPTAETSSLSDSVTQDAGDIGEKRAGDDSGNNTAVVLFSMDPYTDFRRSMQDMIRMHHGQESQSLDWEFLEELLFYYLQLNDRSVHKYILKAFADLTAGTHKNKDSPAALG
ncbi:unnamed protein product [Alopecurus aequalis]